MYCLESGSRCPCGCRNSAVYTGQPAQFMFLQGWNNHSYILTVLFLWYHCRDWLHPIQNMDFQQRPSVHPSLVTASPDIVQCQRSSEVRGNADQDPLDLIGAGDQGLMFGSQWMKRQVTHAPFLSHSSHKPVRRLAELRKPGEISYLRPDSHWWISEYDENDPASARG